MTCRSFNSGWTTRPRVGPFDEMGGPAAAATNVTLPHDSVISLGRSAGFGAATGYFPGGAFEYTKTFDIPADYRDKRVTIEFDGVYRDAMVFINGAFAAQRPSGYSRFFVRADPFLKYGETNVIAVEARAHEDSRWYTGAGIHRGTSLWVSDLVHIAPDGVRITTPDIDPERAIVAVATTVENESTSTRTVSVRTILHAAGGSTVARGSDVLTLFAGESAVVRQRLSVRAPALWGPDSPTLYEVSTAILDGASTVDERATMFGIRRLQLDPEHGLRINGETVKLRGACIHHDNGVIGSAAIARAEERRVEILRKAGFNAIRSAHNPVSTAMLEACDRHGMLVMDETFDVWTQAKSSFDYSLAFPTWWESDVEAMVAKDYNHPSVVLYSIGNEIPETGNPVSSRWGRLLAEKVRNLDDTRFVTNAINGMVSVLPDVRGLMADQAGAGDNAQGVNAMMSRLEEMMGQIAASPLVSDRTAESFGVLDVGGINYGESRYELDRELFPNRIIVGSETFPTTIHRNWALVVKHGHVIGDFTWTGWDYLGEAGIGRLDRVDEHVAPHAFSGPFPWLTAWCADIDITGHRRSASYFRETVFGLRHEPYIAVQRPEFYGRETTGSPWAWTDSVASWSWSAATGAHAVVEVYSDADEVELELNGRSLGRQPAGAAHAFQARFDVAYEPGELAAVSYVEGIEQARTTLRSAAGALELAVTADRSVIRADDTDLAYLDIILQDSHGTVYRQLDRPVTVEVTGAGVLQGLGSACPATLESFTNTTHSTFDGRAVAVIRPTGVGVVTVTVSTDGAEPVTLHLSAQDVGNVA